MQSAVHPKSINLFLTNRAVILFEAWYIWPPGSKPILSLIFFITSLGARVFMWTSVPVRHKQNSGEKFWKTFCFPDKEAKVACITFYLFVTSCLECWHDGWSYTSHPATTREKPRNISSDITEHESTFVILSRILVMWEKCLLIYLWLHS